MTRKRSSPLGLEFLVSITLAVILLPILTQAAPLQDASEIQQYMEGCYYNYNHYNEGDRILTNEPCLNCTCHNRMLMCYLRVCPFTKPIGHDCIVEKREDQCCPIITCPEVPVDVAHHAPEPGTELSIPEKYGCSIDSKFYPEGAQVPSNPNKPCELCYCIKNRTSCLMQECTLHIDGCTPIYNRGSCCPVRYNCDHENELELEDQSTTTTTTERPTPGFILTTTMTPSVSTDCIHNGEVYADGASIIGKNACEHCYCMRGDIVCAVQECEMPMLSSTGKTCHALPPPEGECCPSNYVCEDDTATTEIIPASTTAYVEEEGKFTTVSPIKDVQRPSEEDIQLQTHIDEDEETKLATEAPQQQGKPSAEDELGSGDYATVSDIDVADKTTVAPAKPDTDSLVTEHPVIGSSVGPSLTEKEKEAESEEESKEKVESTTFEAPVRFDERIDITTAASEDLVSASTEKSIEGEEKQSLEPGTSKISVPESDLQLDITTITPDISSKTEGVKKDKEEGVETDEFSTTISPSIVATDHKEAEKEKEKPGAEEKEEESIESTTVKPLDIVDKLEKESVDEDKEKISVTTPQPITSVEDTGKETLDKKEQIDISTIKPEEESTESEKLGEEEVPSATTIPSDVSEDKEHEKKRKEGIVSTTSPIIPEVQKEEDEKEIQQGEEPSVTTAAPSIVGGEKDEGDKEKIEEGELSITTSQPEISEGAKKEGVPKEPSTVPIITELEAEKQGEEQSVTTSQPSTDDSEKDKSEEEKPEKAEPSATTIIPVTEVEKEAEQQKEQDISITTIAPIIAESVKEESGKEKPTEEEPSLTTGKPAFIEDEKEKEEEPSVTTPYPSVIKGDKEGEEEIPKEGEPSITTTKPISEAEAEKEGEEQKEQEPSITTAVPIIAEGETEESEEEKPKEEEPSLVTVKPTVAESEEEEKEEEHKEEKPSLVTVKPVDESEEEEKEKEHKEEEPSLVTVKPIVAEGEEEEQEEEHKEEKPSLVTVKPVAESEEEEKKEEHKGEEPSVAEGEEKKEEHEEEEPSVPTSQPPVEVKEKEGEEEKLKAGETSGTTIQPFVTEAEEGEGEEGKPKENESTLSTVKPFISKDEEEKEKADEPSIVTVQPTISESEKEDIEKEGPIGEEPSLSTVKPIITEKGEEYEEKEPSATTVQPSITAEDEKEGEEESKEEEPYITTIQPHIAESEGEEEKQKDEEPLVQSITDEVEKEEKEKPMEEEESTTTIAPSITEDEKKIEQSKEQEPSITTAQPTVAEDEKEKGKPKEGEPSATTGQPIVVAGEKEEGVEEIPKGEEPFTPTQSTIAEDQTKQEGEQKEELPSVTTVEPSVSEGIKEKEEPIPSVPTIQPVTDKEEKETERTPEREEITPTTAQPISEEEKKEEQSTEKETEILSVSKGEEELPIITTIQPISAEEDKQGKGEEPTISISQPVTDIEKEKEQVDVDITKPIDISEQPYATTVSTTEEEEVQITTVPSIAIASEKEKEPSEEVIEEISTSTDKPETIEEVHEHELGSTQSTISTTEKIADKRIDITTDKEPTEEGEKGKPELEPITIAPVASKGEEPSIAPVVIEGEQPTVSPVVAEEEETFVSTTEKDQERPDVIGDKVPPEFGTELPEKSKEDILYQTTSKEGLETSTESEEGVSDISKEKETSIEKDTTEKGEQKPEISKEPSATMATPTEIVTSIPEEDKIVEQEPTVEEEKIEGVTSSSEEEPASESISSIHRGDIDLATISPIETEQKPEVDEEQNKKTVTTKIPLDVLSSTPTVPITSEEEVSEEEISTSTKVGEEPHYTTIGPTVQPSASEQPDTESETEIEPAEITTIKPTSSEDLSQEQMFDMQLPAVIPGEGDCLVGQKTYPNNSIVTPSNECEKSCKCVSSILICDKIICDLPENLDKCVLDKTSSNKCCPSYICGIDSLPPKSETELEKQEEEEEIAYTTSSPPHRIHISLTIPPLIEEVESTTHVESEGAEEEITIKPPEDIIIPVGSTELPMSHVKDETISEEETITSKPEKTVEEKIDIIPSTEASSTAVPYIEEDIVPQTMTPIKSEKPILPGEKPTIPDTEIEEEVLAATTVKPIETPFAPTIEEVTSQTSIPEEQQVAVEALIPTPSPIETKETVSSTILPIIEEEREKEGEIPTITEEAIETSKPSESAKEEEEEAGKPGLGERIGEEVPSSTIVPFIDENTKAITSEGYEEPTIAPVLSEKEEIEKENIAEAATKIPELELTEKEQEEIESTTVLSTAADEDKKEPATDVTVTTLVPQEDQRLTEKTDLSTSAPATSDEEKQSVEGGSTTTVSPILEETKKKPIDKGEQKEDKEPLEEPSATAKPSVDDIEKIHKEGEQKPEKGEIEEKPLAITSSPSEDITERPSEEDTEKTDKIKENPETPTEDEEKPIAKDETIPGDELIPTTSVPQKDIEGISGSTIAPLFEEGEAIEPEEVEKEFAEEVGSTTTIIPTHEDKEIETVASTPASIKEGEEVSTGPTIVADEKEVISETITTTIKPTKEEGAESIEEEELSTGAPSIDESKEEGDKISITTIAPEFPDLSKKPIQKADKESEEEIEAPSVEEEEDKTKEPVSSTKAPSISEEDKDHVEEPSSTISASVEDKYEELPSTTIAAELAKEEEKTDIQPGIATDEDSVFEASTSRTKEEPLDVITGITTPASSDNVTKIEEGEKVSVETTIAPIIKEEETLEPEISTQTPATSNDKVVGEVSFDTTAQPEKEFIDHTVHDISGAKIQPHTDAPISAIPSEQEISEVTDKDVIAHTTILPPTKEEEPITPETDSIVEEPKATKPPISLTESSTILPIKDTDIHTMSPIEPIQTTKAPSVIPGFDATAESDESIESEEEVTTPHKVQQIAEFVTERIEEGITEKLPESEKDVSTEEGEEGEVDEEEASGEKEHISVTTAKTSVESETTKPEGEEETPISKDELTEDKGKPIYPITSIEEESTEQPIKEESTQQPHIPTTSVEYSTESISSEETSTEEPKASEEAAELTEEYKHKEAEEGEEDASTVHPLFPHISITTLPPAIPASIDAKIDANATEATEATPQKDVDETQTTGIPTETVTSESPVVSEPPITTTAASVSHYQPPPPIYGQPPQYPSYSEDEYTDEEESEVFGPGTCRYGGKLYVSAQQIPRDDPCDFCFCFRSDIICLQQSCPPPISGCHEEPISGFCCPRYECPVSMATVLNITTSTTTTSTTLPPHFLHHSYGGAVQRVGCQINGRSYKVGETIESTSGPCINCKCGGDGKMKCDPQACVPEPTMQQVMAVVASGRKR